MSLRTGVRVLGHLYNNLVRKVRNQSRSAISRAREMRRNRGESEKKLWALLRNRKHGFKFRSQQPVDRYFLDFYCAEARLCVELDGEQHVTRKDKDAERDMVLAGLGIATLRVTTWHLYEDPEGTVELIWNRCNERIQE